MTAALERMRRGVMQAERVAAARASFDLRRAGHPARWAPQDAKAEWEAVVRAVYDERGGGRGAVAFIAHAAGIDPSSAWRTVHGRGSGEHAA